MTVQPESRLQARIQKRLKNDVGGFWVKIWGGPFQQAGLPDLFGCVDGYFFGLEVKTPKGKPTALQLHMIEKIKQAGGGAAIVRSPDEAVEYVERFLQTR